MTLYPYSPPLTYHSPGAWSEVTSMVTYVILPEYETYLHGYYLQVELTQITLIYRTLKRWWTHLLLSYQESNNNF